ncbi:hypothetical protein [Nocardia wallacei]|uniref:hypothetical protein n=1 Tax=Nocardia wallacei TaxID=480035 RepID=UPI0024569C8C|nr:hypothetical protein [Nocardia wallacei]
MPSPDRDRLVASLLAYEWGGVRSAHRKHTFDSDCAICTYNVEAIADGVIAHGWQPPHRRIETAEELDALPPGTVVRSAVGTVACRHHSGLGVLFGNGEPFDWAQLRLPVIVIPVPDWKADYAPDPEGGR